MPPRSQPLPEATTESAREARKSFFCELCQKQYDRMDQIEAHENSYDHQHNKRRKEMLQMTRDPKAAARARQAEQRANQEAGLRSISSSASLMPSNQNAAGAEKKKKAPVFKSTLQPHNAVAVTGKPHPTSEQTIPDTSISKPPQDESMRDAEDASGDASEYKAKAGDSDEWSGHEYEPPFSKTPDGLARWKRRDNPREFLSPVMDVVFKDGKLVMVPFENGKPPL